MTHVHSVCYAIGVEFGPGFRPGEPIKNHLGKLTGEVLSAIKSPLVISVVLYTKEVSLELLPGAALWEVFI